MEQGSIAAGDAKDQRDVVRDQRDIRADRKDMQADRKDMQAAGYGEYINQVEDIA